MSTRLLLAFLLFASAPTLAQDSDPVKSSQSKTGEVGTQAPVLANLLKNPAYLNAWQAMLASQNSPDWVTEYSATFDGPPVPNIPVVIEGETYTLGYVCRPNACEDNQLFVLFAPDGRKAWALMATASAGPVWLGSPDGRIQTAINGALTK